MKSLGGLLCIGLMGWEAPCSGQDNENRLKIVGISLVQAIDPALEQPIGFVIQVRVEYKFDHAHAAATAFTRNDPKIPWVHATAPGLAFEDLGGGADKEGYSAGFYTASKAAPKDVAITLGLYQVSSSHLLPAKGFLLGPLATDTAMIAAKDFENAPAELTVTRVRVETTTVDAPTGGQAPKSTVTFLRMPGCHIGALRSGWAKILFANEPPDPPSCRDPGTLIVPYAFGKKVQVEKGEIQYTTPAMRLKLRVQDP
jgi:hypothetical protein